jgi:hypothetical protein
LLDLLCESHLKSFNLLNLSSLICKNEDHSANLTQLFWDLRGHAGRKTFQTIDVQKHTPLKELALSAWTTHCYRTQLFTFFLSVEIRSWVEFKWPASIITLNNYIRSPWVDVSQLPGPFILENDTPNILKYPCSIWLTTSDKFIIDREVIRWTNPILWKLFHIIFL